MTLRGSIQVVVMAGGKGSRMTDLTSSKSKCLLPVGGLPLLWYPLNMLQNEGFTEVIVVVQDSAKSEVSKIPERFSLSLKLDVVGIPGNEELGTADSLRKVADKLNGSDILIVSGDVILEKGIRGLVDKHRINRSALTAMLAVESADMKSVTVPGPKTKFKRDKDLIGLSGDSLCLFTAEADVEEEVSLSRKILRTHPKIIVHSDLLDAHVYLMQKWVADYVVAERNISTIKGELLPLMVKKQFGKVKPQEDSSCEKIKLVDFVPTSNKLLYEEDKSKRYSCYVHLLPPETLCTRVNSLPAYWVANALSVPVSVLGASSCVAGEQGQARAQVGAKASLSEVRLGNGAVVSDRTTLSRVSLGAGARVEEKVRISNSIVMDNVTIGQGCNIQDSIICDNSTLVTKVNMKNCIVGKGQTVEEGSLDNQLLLDKDRMMEV